MPPKRRQGAPTNAQRLKLPPGLYRSFVAGQVVRIGEKLKQPDQDQQEEDAAQPSNADQEAQQQEQQHQQQQQPDGEVELEEDEVEDSHDQKPKKKQKSMVRHQYLGSRMFSSTACVAYQLGLTL